MSYRWVRSETTNSRNHRSVPTLVTWFIVKRKSRRDYRSQRLQKFPCNIGCQTHTSLGIIRYTTFTKRKVPRRWYSPILLRGMWCAARTARSGALVYRRPLGWKMGGGGGGRRRLSALESWRLWVRRGRTLRSRRCHGRGWWGVGRCRHDCHRLFSALSPLLVIRSLDRRGRRQNLIKRRRWYDRKRWRWWRSRLLDYLEFQT